MQNRWGSFSFIGSLLSIPIWKVVCYFLAWIRVKECGGEEIWTQKWTTCESSRIQWSFPGHSGLGKCSNKRIRKHFGDSSLNRNSYLKPFVMGDFTYLILFLVLNSSVLGKLLAASSHFRWVLSMMPVGLLESSGYEHHSLTLSTFVHLDTWTSCSLEMMQSKGWPQPSSLIGCGAQALDPCFTSRCQSALTHSCRAGQSPSHGFIVPLPLPSCCSSGWSST